MTLVSFIIPTLNSANVIEPCLRSIFSQTITNWEIIIADGGSTDGTITKIKKIFPRPVKGGDRGGFLKLKITKNPLQTAEAGKAVGLRSARGQYLALIDSDNILPSPDWLQKMLSPLEKDSSLVGSEPLSFSYRSRAGFIERYSALLGANDPYAYVAGVYDRYSYLSRKWTGLKIGQKNFPGYIKVSLLPHQPLPTIGANGTVFRAEFLKKYSSGNYLFDIDLLTKAIHRTSQPLYFAKVKVGIIHTFCESSPLKFFRKQRRRLLDFYRYRHLRRYQWSRHQKLQIIYFIFYTIFISPFAAIIGYFHRPDPAWIFHPVACYLTLFAYVFFSFARLVNPRLSQDRRQWRQ